MYTATLNCHHDRIGMSMVDNEESHWVLDKMNGKVEWMDDCSVPIVLAYK